MCWKIKWKSLIKNVKQLNLLRFRRNFPNKRCLLFFLNRGSMFIVTSSYFHLYKFVCSGRKYWKWYKKVQKKKGPKNIFFFIRIFLQSTSRSECIFPSCKSKKKFFSNCLWDLLPFVPFYLLYLFTFCTFLPFCTILNISLLDAWVKLKSSFKTRKFKNFSFVKIENDNSIF